MVYARSCRLHDRPFQATKRLAFGAERTAERQLRAYALVKSIHVKNEAINPGFFHPVAFIFLKNFGEVPAKHLTYWLEITAAPMQNPDSVLKQGAKTAPAHVAVIGPGDIFKIRATVPLDMEIADSTHGVYVFGRVTYHDGFNDQLTDFRFVREGAAWSNNGEFDMCQDGNDCT